MAEAVDGEVVGSDLDAVVRCEPLTVILPLDRDRLAGVPGHPPPDVPLVCLDTETTGLATAAGTMAFLVGLGWWEADRFRQAQLLLPDQPNEPALLALLEAHIPRNAWLVTYNGRGFDWPLLVARYRMARRDPPVHAGHLDLLPFVRRVFKHRMTDARLRTVETELLGVARHEDVDGWEIPGRYLDFLRSGLAEPLLAVVRHNREDVRSLARLLVHVEVQFADEDGRRLAHRGDLAGLARAYSRERRLEEALGCLDTAVGASPAIGPPAADDDLWWTPRRPVDYGGKPQLRSLDGATPTGLAMDGGADPRRAGAASSAPRPVCGCRRSMGGARGGHRADRCRRLGRGRQASRASTGRSRGRVRGSRAGPATSRSGAGAWAGSTRRSIEPSRFASSD